MRGGKLKMLSVRISWAAARTTVQKRSEVSPQRVEWARLDGQ